MPNGLFMIFPLGKPHRTIMHQESNILQQTFDCNFPVSYPVDNCRMLFEPQLSSCNGTQT